MVLAVPPLWIRTGRIDALVVQGTGLLNVVEGLDVLVQLSIQRWSLVGIRDHFDVGGAVGLFGRLERLVELATGGDAGGEPVLAAHGVAWGSST